MEALHGWGGTASQLMKCAGGNTGWFLQTRREDGLGPLGYLVNLLDVFEKPIAT